MLPRRAALGTQCVSSPLSSRLHQLGGACFMLHAANRAAIVRHAALRCSSARSINVLAAGAADVHIQRSAIPRLVKFVGGGLLTVSALVALTPAILSTSLGLHAVLAAANVFTPTHVTIAEALPRRACSACPWLCLPSDTPMPGARAWPVARASQACCAGLRALC